MNEEKKSFDKTNVWVEKEKRGHKAMCLAYAKDLVVAGTIDKEELLEAAQKMFAFIWGK